MTRRQIAALRETMGLHSDAAVVVMAVDRMAITGTREFNSILMAAIKEHLVTSGISCPDHPWIEDVTVEWEEIGVPPYVRRNAWRYKCPICSKDLGAPPDELVGSEP